jgi:hypothetical protein
VYSIIRSQEQASSLKELGAEPIVQSIEESSVSDLSATISKSKPDVIVWSAGAGGKDGPHRTDAVDRVGAIKVGCEDLRLNLASVLRTEYLYHLLHRPSPSTME